MHVSMVRLNPTRDAGTQLQLASIKVAAARVTRWRGASLGMDRTMCHADVGKRLPDMYMNDWSDVSLERSKNIASGRNCISATRSDSHIGGRSGTAHQRYALTAVSPQGPSKVRQRAYLVEALVLLVSNPFLLSQTPTSTAEGSGIIELRLRRMSW